ncbi:MAG: BppU family phage baseplate upper protein [Inconstantimicrobium porci]|uniref:BppU family phage baseplate upper protein n=1 Tax=Inconstantimicrobium porci TaxID=2652291 RepID=UPI002A908EB2|nr:BppU family phage baseplate upper protein [Inconstantimicrobium porci]MDY5910589.1 BppU family phage baseplate upper protein [Inconstantimicrobium porci]
MNRYVKTLYVDIDRKIHETIEFKQKDTIRCLNVFLKSNGVAYDLTGLAVRLFVRKPDGTIVYKQATLTNATLGQCRIDITTQMLAVPGTVKSEIGIFELADDGTVKNVLSTIPFVIKVIESVRDDSAIVSTNDYSDILDNIVTTFLNDKISGGVITGLGLADGDITENLIANNAISEDKIKDESITIDKTNFIKATDVFDKNKVETGYSLNSAGNTITNSNGITSGYIETKANNIYTIPGQLSSICFYDSSKTFIKRLTKQTDYVYTADSDGYIRFTWDKTIITDINNIHVYIKDSYEFTGKLNNINADGISGELSLDNIPSGVKDNLVDKDKDTIYLKWDSTYKNVYIYMKATEGWLRYIFKHLTRNSTAKASAISGGETLASCYDVWRERGVYLASKNVDNTFNDLYPNDPLIHSAAEWETAIKTYDSANSKYHDDFIGGSVHGDEVTENVIFVVDGKFYDDVTKLDGLTCKEFRIYRSGSLYECGTLELDDNLAVTSGNKLANHTVDYLYKDNSLTINQNVNWLVTTKCDYSCLAMLGVRRKSENLGIQISNKGIRENEAIISDCSVADFTDQIATSIENCNKAMLWNDGTVTDNPGWNCTFSAEVLEKTDLSGQNFKVSNHDSYNKMYFGYCSLDQEVNKGDVWHCKAKYKIDYKGAY